MKKFINILCLFSLILVVLFANSVFASSEEIANKAEYIKLSDGKDNTLVGRMEFQIEFKSPGDYKISITNNDNNRKINPAFIHMVDSLTVQTVDADDTNLYLAIHEPGAYGIQLSYEGDTGVTQDASTTYDIRIEKVSTEVSEDAGELAIEAGVIEEESIFERTNNYFEIVLVKFFLEVGDYASDYLSDVFKEDITIGSIVYNKVNMLNANFFSKSPDSAKTSAASVVKDAINKWYAAFRLIALLACVVCVVLIGMKMMLGTPSGKAGAYDLLKKLIIGIALVFLFPYAMKLGFDLNTALINSIYQSAEYGTTIGASISTVSDLKSTELEFRSPQYVSKSMFNIAAGSTEATELYVSKLKTYASTADIMRIMRAFAGVTLRFMYVIIWYIMLAQTYMLVIIYLKRYITIAFLIAIYPLMVIGYVAGGLFGQKQNSFNEWCKKFFSNVFLQSLHAIIYGAICGIVIDQIRTSMVEELININWLVVIIATTFLFTGEKIMTRLWSAAITASADRKGIGKVLNAPVQAFRKITGK